MKIEATCPNCGAEHTVTTQSAEAFRISCGCGEQYLSFDARRSSGKTHGWMKRARPGNSARPRGTRPGGPILKGHTSGGKVVPREIAEKLRKAYGGTGTGRNSTGAMTHYKPNDAIQVADSADGELRFIDSKSLTWPKDGFKWDLASPTEGEKESPKKSRFTGHGAPDIRSKLVRQFQDVFGRDQ